MSYPRTADRRDLHRSARQRNSREENAKIKADEATKLIQYYQETPANVHDGQFFDDLLNNEIIDTQGKKRAFYANSAYRSQELEANQAAQELESQIHEKGSCSTTLTEEQQASNRRKLSVLARGEHIFGAQAVESRCGAVA